MKREEDDLPRTPFGRGPRAAQPKAHEEGAGTYAGIKIAHGKGRYVLRVHDDQPEDCES